MGMGGSKGMDAQLRQQELQMQMAQNSLLAQQAEYSRNAALQDAASRKAIADQFAAANGQTPDAQAAAKLSVMDFIHTSPSGLLNEPKSGKYTLLGN